MQVMPGGDHRERHGRAGLVGGRHAGQDEDAGPDDRADAMLVSPTGPSTRFRRFSPFISARSILEGFRGE